MHDPKMPLEKQNKEQPMSNSYVNRICKTDPHTVLTEVLGERYAQYRDKWNTASAQNIPDFPVHIDLQLIDKCNLQCSFCPQTIEKFKHFTGKVNTGCELPYSIVQRLATEAREHQLHSLNIGFGAEPLLSSYFAECIDMFHAAGVIDIWIITNGVLLEKYSQKIMSTAVTNLFVSIDALTQPVYQKMRGSTLQHVVDGISSLLKIRAEHEKNLPLIRVSFINHPDNTHEKDDFIHYWQDKVDFIDIQNFFDFSVQNFEQTVTHKKRDCLDPYRRLSVYGNGDVTPCCTRFGRNFIVGNVYTQNLYEIWHGDALRAFRESLLQGKNSVCNFCLSM